MTKVEKNKYIKLITKGTLILKDLSEELKSDKEIVAESIKKGGARSRKESANAC